MGEKQSESFNPKPYEALNIQEFIDLQMIPMGESSDPTLWTEQWAEKFRMAFDSNSHYFAELFHRDPHACAKEVMELASRIVLPENETQH